MYRESIEVGSEGSAEFGAHCFEKFVHLENILYEIQTCKSIYSGFIMFRMFSGSKTMIMRL